MFSWSVAAIYGREFSKLTAWIYDWLFVSVEQHFSFSHTNTHTHNFLSLKHKLFFIHKQAAVGGI